MWQYFEGYASEIGLNIFDHSNILHTNFNTYNNFFINQKPAGSNQFCYR